MSFELDPRLAADTFFVGDMKLCRVLLMNDANYPWFILVPRRPGVREIYELSTEDQNQLMHESAQVGQALMDTFTGHKLNIAALGNQVPQLHLHHIVRFEDDPAWPGPVWGKHPRTPYSQHDSAERITLVAAELATEGP